MDGMFAGNTDPVPYIAAAYLIGCILIFGMPAFFHLQSMRLDRVLNSIKSAEKGKHHAS